MSQQAMDLRTSTAVLRQRWRLLAMAGAVGLVLGIAYAVLQPARLGSTTLVLLPTPTATQESGAQVETQLRIVLSTTVLDRAGKSVKPVMSARTVEKRLDVSAPTDQLISIRAFAPRPADAKALSQAVADSYIATVRDTARTVTAATLSDLRKREADLTNQVKALQSEIDTTAARQKAGDPASTEGRRDAQLMAQLRAEQANISLQLDKVKDDIASSAALGGASQAGTSIIQPASPASGPGLISRILSWGPMGALLGAIAAAVVLLVQLRRDPRVRARDDLADAVGSAVLAGVRSRPQQSVAEWSTLLESYEVGPVEAWAFRQVLRGLLPADVRGPIRRTDGRQPGRIDHPRSVTVISLSGDERGLAIGPQLAVFAASLGLSTRLVAVGGHDSAASLWAACAADRGSGPRPGLTVSVRAANAVPSGRRSQPLMSQRDKPRSGGLDDDIKSRLAAILGKKPDSSGADDSTGTSDETAGAQWEPTPALEAAEGSAPEWTVDDLGEPVDLTVVLTVADRGEPSLMGIPATVATLLTVAPGTATQVDLARLAVAVDDAGRRVDGIVVADPDPADRTTGRHTLDERARHAALPVRLTGVGPMAVRAADRGRAR